MSANRDIVFREPLLTKTQHVIAGVAPELVPHLRALRPHTMESRRSGRTAEEDTPLSRELVKQILSALRAASEEKRAQAAPVTLLKAAWNRVDEELTDDTVPYEEDEELPPL